MALRPAWLNGDALRAGTLLMGMMVGVGFFGIPFAMAKAGFGVGLAWLAVLGVVVALFNLMVAELVLSTEGNHQLVGLTTIWLGPWGRRWMTAAQVLSFYGALLAYIIVAGEFLHNILSQVIAVDPQWYAVTFSVGWALVWFLRPRSMERLDVVMAFLYAGIIALIVAVAWPHVHIDYLRGWTPDYWYLPYGVILFSLTGVSAIPIARAALGAKAQLLKPAIIGSMLVVCLLYGFFAFSVVGLSGGATSPEAVYGLYGLLGEPIILLGSLLGVLTVSTSYIMTGTALFEVFHLDYRMPRLGAWLLSLLPPLMLFWFGVRDFVGIIAMVGALAVGITAVLLSLAYLKARRHRLRVPEFRLNIPIIIVWLMTLLFAAGVVRQLFLSSTGVS